MDDERAALSRAARIFQAGWSPLTFAAVGMLLGAALTAFGIVALVRERSSGPAPAAAQDAWARSAASAATPAFLAQPVVQTGDGWSMETRVGNLAKLDLVIAAGGTLNQLALIDVHSGQAVAVGTFGYNINARLRTDPRQLLIADRGQASSSDRLLVFDLNDTGVTLAAETPLPDRVGCKGNFCNWMYLSNDRDLLIPHRSTIASPDCPGDAARCLVYSFDQVDLNEPAVLRQIQIPLAPPCSMQPPSCTGVDVCGSMDVEPAPDSGALIRCNDLFLRITPHGQPGAPFGFTESGVTAVFGTVLPDGSARAITFSGELHAWSAANTDLGATRLLTKSNLHVEAVSRVDDTHALVSVFTSSENIAALLLVDLAKSKVAAEMEVPRTVWSVTVLDPSRAVLLLRTDTTAALQQVDLIDGKLGKVVPLRNPPGLPSEVVR